MFAGERGEVGGLRLSGAEGEGAARGRGDVGEDEGEGEGVGWCWGGRGHFIRCYRHEGGEIV